MNFDGDLENFPPLYSAKDTFMRRFFLQKRAEFQAEMETLLERKHQRYIQMMKECEDDFRMELEAQEIAEKLEKERITEQYERDRLSAEKELEERLTELMDTMIQECDETRKKIEHEYHNSDISSAPANDFPNKKSLRRRPNEPTPFSEKQMQAKTRPIITFKLTDQEIQEDLQLLEEIESKNT